MRLAARLPHIDTKRSAAEKLKGNETRGAFAVTHLNIVLLLDGFLVLVAELHNVAVKEGKSKHEKANLTEKEQNMGAGIVHTSCQSR